MPEFLSVSERYITVPPFVILLPRNQTGLPFNRLSAVCKNTNDVVPVLPNYAINPEIFA